MFETRNSIRVKKNIKSIKNNDENIMLIQFFLGH